MGYLFLAFAVGGNLLKAFSGKKTSGFMKTILDAFSFSTIRLGLSALFGIFFMLPDLFRNGLSVMALDLNLLPTYLLSAIANAGMVITWLLFIRSGVLVLMDVSALCGCLIPLILSRIFYFELIKPTHIIGLVVLFGAVILMASYNNSIKAKLNAKSILLLFGFGISSGFIDFSQKLFRKQTMNNVPSSVFNFYTLLFAFVILLIILIVMRTAKDNEAAKLEIKPKALFHISLMAVGLCVVSLFKTLAAGHLPSALVFPFYQSSAIISNAILGAICFKERISFKSVASLTLMALGLVIMNFL
jgi:drug/metabolite transporter (DMT)-like permease